ncbi:MAG: calcium-binding protein [Tateyamaria sp.]|uniref:hypothetical protein n=1 Tax=Tateyamaria sp. TaxID=1929288 RepID=UPI00329D0F2B
MSIDTDGLKAITLPEDVDFGRLVAIGPDILLIQEDGTVVVLLGGAKNNFVVQADGVVVPASKLREAAEKDGDWAELSDIRDKSLFEILNPDSVSFNSGEQEQVDVGDPLIGLPYNPLLPPTDYQFIDRREHQNVLGDSGSAPSELNIVQEKPIVLAETDSFLNLRLAGYIEIGVGDNNGEEITSVSVQIDGLPVGTTVNFGSLSAAPSGLLSLNFTGTGPQYEALTVVLPRDFSSDARSDAPPGDLSGSVSAISNLLGAAEFDFSFQVIPEGDVEIDVTPQPPLVETDLPVTFAITDYLTVRTDPSTPAIDTENLDQDGSEAIENLTLTITGLPTDPSNFTLNSIISGGQPLPGATLTIDPATGSSIYTVFLDGADLALFDAISVELPIDFSTTNRSDLTNGATSLPIDVTLEAVSNEDIATPGALGGGRQTETAQVIVEDTPDVVLTAPTQLSGTEDQDGSQQGVLIDLDLEITVDDADLSERADTPNQPFGTVAEVSFSGLPATGATAEYLGQVVSISDASTLTLSVAQAQDLQIRFPTGFNTGLGNTNPVLISTTARTSEGEVSDLQEIAIAPQTDIAFSITPIVTNETDGPVTVTPSAHWVVFITGPSESITNITFTLDDLPTGVTFPAGGTITYDAANGGPFTFSGTEADYLALTLTFPRDFSTGSRNDFASGDLTGTIEASSTDGGPVTGPALSVEIIPEGDVEIDTAAATVALNETNDPVSFLASDYLVPRVAPSTPVDNAENLDQDGSESIVSLTVTITGLPNDSVNFTADDVTSGGAPVQGGTLTVAADGATTYSVVLTGADVALYDDLTVTLPADFSTTNRNDLNSAFEQPILLTVLAVTDEDLSTPGALGGGTLEDTAAVIVKDTSDLALTAPDTLNGVEDGDPGGVGVTVDLGINIVVGDIDGSETDTALFEDRSGTPTVPGGTAFGTTVTVQFTDLPAGSVLQGGGAFDNSTGLWTGTVAQANALTVTLPANYSGTFSTVVTAANFEGTEKTSQTVEITPSTDIVFNVTPIEMDETDASVTVTPSKSWSVSTTDPNESLTNISFTLQNLPAGVTFPAGGTVTYDPNAGGTFIFSGSEAEYLALTLTFPRDFSTSSRNDFAPGYLPGTIEATSSDSRPEDGPDVGPALVLTIVPEGDIASTPGVDQTLLETDSAVTFLVSDSIALPSVAPSAPLDDAENLDQDGSEALESITLTITGLPNDPADFSASNVTSGGLSVPGGALTIDGTTGASTYTVTLTGVDIALYNDLTVEVPADFSTTNRTDLSNGSTALDIDMTLEARTDEVVAPDGSLGGGTATETATVIIEDTPDILLEADLLVIGREDDGAIGPPAPGVTLDMPITIAILDSDLSENAADTAPPSDFGTNVEIRFLNLPADVIFNKGVLNGNVWTGSVADATDDARGPLQITFPGDYSGSTLAVVRVTTPEGSVIRPQLITVTPVPDVVITGEILSQETDDPLTIRLSVFIDVVITDPSENLTELDFTFPDLPLGTTSNAGSFQQVGGTLTFSYNSLTDPVAPEYVELTLPADYSSTSPLQELKATLEVTTDQTPPGTPVTGEIYATIDFEGDVVIIGSGPADLEETDAPVDFVPSTFLLPKVDPADPTVPVDRVDELDDDGSESIDYVTLIYDTMPPDLVFSGVPAGTITYDVIAGGAFAFVGSEAEYAALVITFPKDFSTQNRTDGFSDGPITGNLTVFTDEAGEATESLDITISPEGDIELVGPGFLALDENDPSNPPIPDVDSTTTVPVDFKPADAVTARPTDEDGSEFVEEVDLSLTGLPTGSSVSTDNGLTFTPFAGTYTATNLTLMEYEALVFRLPDDYSTTSAGNNDAGNIEGDVEFRTNEAVDAGEGGTDPTDGVINTTFTVTVNDEADVAIEAQARYERAEDQWSSIPLDLDAQAVDIDTSETIIEPVTVTFDDLPAGGMEVTFDVSGVSTTQLLTPAANVWSGSVASLQTLTVTSLPVHFSGIIPGTVNVITDEGTTTGSEKSFEIRITPLAEPTIELSVVPDGTDVVEYATDQYAVKEDTGFLLRIAASTPDTDGSETLTRIVIENVPTLWLPDGDVLGFFQAPTPDVASATKAGTTVTIEFATASTVTSFTNDLQLTLGPEHSDLDVATVLGSDLLATVTAVDAPVGLPSDTGSASDGTDVDVDSVVDGIDISTIASNMANEQLDPTKKRGVSLGLDNLELEDQDGSETFTGPGFTTGGLEVTLTVATESDNFDPSNPNLLELRVQTSALRGFATITQTASTPDSVTYFVTPTAGTSNDDFIEALESLQVRVPGKFSGVITNDSTAFWSETTTPDTLPGDVEIDTSDNQNSTTFQTEIEIKPRAEADLTFSAFVREDDQTSVDVPDGEPMRIEGEALSAESISIGSILTLLESTSDQSDDFGPQGQVELYLGIAASTPDTDGSEQLDTLTIANVPSDWVADFLTGTDIDLAILRSSDGSGPLATNERDKVDSIEFVSNDPVPEPDAGLLTIRFVPDVINFDASLVLTPSFFEDYDIDDQTPFPTFTSQGDFFGDDLRMTLNTIDDNTRRTDTESADVTLDVDVDPVNNKAFLISASQGNEAVIDSTNTGNGGIWDVQILFGNSDQDGTETLTALVIRDLPSAYSVFVPTNPDAPDGNFKPALITEINPDGTIDWSLQNNEWQNLQIRGIPLHFAGDFPLQLEAVTTEADGGGTGVTQLSETLYIQPVADGGNPGTTADGVEDTARLVSIDGNIIDLTPESPEEVLNGFVLSNVQPDSFGRMPRFFDGLPIPDPSNPGDFTNEIQIGVGPVIILPSVAAQLHVLPGTDSNEDIRFSISAEYFEKIDPLEFKTDVGLVDIVVKGVADPAIITVQESDPDQTIGPTIPIGTVNPDYRPNDDDTDGDGMSDGSGVNNYNRLYGYAGNDNGPFLLDKRLTDEALALGADQVTPVYQTAPTLDGQMSEILVTFQDGSQSFDGSEAIYYVISGLTPGITLIGGTPVDPSGKTILVTEIQLPNLAFVPETVSEVTYYDLQFNAIVVEDDAQLQALIDALPQDAKPGGPAFDFDAFLALVDALPGGDVTIEDFTVVVVPEDGDSGMDCTPEQDLDLPILSLIGPLVEDQQGELKLVLTPNGEYQTLGDLLTLPSNVSGDIGIGITLPPGSSLSGSPAGSVLFDPVTGSWAIDLEKLIGSNTNGTESEGSILFTPPPHQSSPTNPFPVDETFGDQDDTGTFRYDELDSLDYTIILNNITCNKTTVDKRSFSIDIQPVVDGPNMVFDGPPSFLEDTLYFPEISITGVDGGERAVGGVVVGLDGDSGGDLFLNGVRLTPDAVDPTTSDKSYNLARADLPNLSLTAREHFSGTLELSVTATSEDLTGAVPLTKTTTETRSVLVIADADVPLIEFKDDLVSPDPDTGQPYVDLTNPAVPVLTIIEDIPFLLSDAVSLTFPDQDGSEIASVVIGSLARPVPDYAIVTLGSGASTRLVDNGDGTYTVNAEDFDKVQIALRDEHARTPDEFDPANNGDIPLSLSAITYEIPNADTEETTQDFVLRVRPDADVPTVAATIDPTMGTEDDPDPYEFIITGTTPDQHEGMSFEISNIPAGGRIFVGTTEVTVTGGVAVIDSKPGASIPGIFAFEPVDTVTFVPPADFAGNVAFEVRAITIDSTEPGAIFVDTEPSAPANVVLEIEVAPDLVVTVDDALVEFDETDATVPYKPYDGFTIDVTDNEASGGPEFVDSITYTLIGVPSNITWSGLSDPGLVTVTNNVLTFRATGATSQAEFEALVLEFPADFSTESRNDLAPGPLVAELNVTTNENGDVTVNNQIDIGATEDLDFVVVTQDVVLTETDLEVDFSPSTAVRAQATDADGSESSTIDLVIEDVPLGTNWTGTGASLNGNNLEFSGNDAEYAALVIHFPADWATNGTPLNALINVTTDEGGANSATFTIEVIGTPDVSATVMPVDQVQTGSQITLDLGVVVEVTPTSAANYEWIEEVVIDFDDPLPTGATVLPPEASVVGQKLTLSGGTAGNQTAFMALVSALAIVVPGDFVGDIAGAVEASSNHGDLMSAVPFTATVADDGPPVITPPPVEINSTDAMFAVPFADLLTNATDADLPLDIQNVGSSAAQVQVSLGSDEVLVTAPNGFVGKPNLTFDVVDAGGASSPSSAILDINTLQMVVVGITTDPDSNVKDLLGDVTGGSGGGDIALGTAGDDGVVLSGSAPYTDIEGFDLLGGSDFIDLSAATRGFKITLGDGDDWAIGGAGDDDISGGADNDILQGEGGSDILTGGAGQDVFVMTDLTASDVISDFDVPVGPTGVDQIDLTTLVSLSGGEVLADKVVYNNASGDLNVNGNTVANVTASTGGFAKEVEVIFNDASNMQATAIV